MRKILLFMSSISIIICLMGVQVLAGGYSNYDRYFVYSKDQAITASSYFSQFWSPTPNPTYIYFTKSNVLDSVGAVSVFYASCHGNAGYMFAGYNGSEPIAAWELASRTVGFYKFVFLDACLTSSDDSMARSFSIFNYDNLNHAYLGFSNESWDAYNYDVFTQQVFQYLFAQRQDLNSALWQAHLDSGVTGYKQYGRWNMTIY